MKILWFTTGRDEEALRLLKEVYEATRKGRIKGYISLCFINREIGESPQSDRIIEFLRKEGIPYETLSTRRFLRERGLTLDSGREIFDEEIRRIIQRYSFDIIFLAGYMLIVSKVLHENFTILNLHPSLPGKYKGKWEEVMRSVILNRDKEFGAMIHLAEERLDEGQPITYFRLTVTEDHILELYDKANAGDEESYNKLFRYLREREFSLETPLIIETLRLLSEGKLEIKEKKVYFDGVEIPSGLDITRQLEEGFNL